MPKSGLVRWHRGAGWLSLWPHWNTLWRVCARGHYAVHRKPLRPKPAGDGDDIEASMQRGLPSQEEGGYRLDLVREEGNDFSPYLHFPGPLAPRYPVNGYARTASFPLSQWASQIEPFQHPLEFRSSRVSIYRIAWRKRARKMQVGREIVPLLSHQIEAVSALLLGWQSALH